MKKSKRCHIVLLSGLIIAACTGCQKVALSEPKESPITSQKAPDHQDAGIASDKSIYNAAFEQYNDVTELAVIISSPTEEDLSHLTTLDTYGNDEEESMLIIPKYNGSKITVSTAEYTGEQYIAKEDLFTNESTPAGYGLRLYAKRPEGIPNLIITVNYQMVNQRYIITSNGKEDNKGIEYLRVEADTGSKNQGDLVLSIQDPDYVKGLQKFSSVGVDIDKDGQNETVEVYCDGLMDEEGEMFLDDGQNWAVILRKGDEIYPLFDKAYIQLGRLRYAVYQDYDDYDKIHILIEYKTGTAIYYYDCTYDDETGGILRRDFFDASNINLIKDWQ